MMRYSRRTWLLTALLTALIAGLAVSGLAHAGKPAKPGGGGGGGTVPPGTIYFVQGDFDKTARSMNADGSGKVASTRGEPSHAVHDGARWFLTGIVSVDDPFGQELFAVADDGVVVPLGVDRHDVYTARWAKDDSFLSYEAYFDTPEGRSKGLFVADVDWSDGFPRIGPPVMVLITIALFDYPFLEGFDWSPSGDEAVYTRTDWADGIGQFYSLEVVRFFPDGTTLTRPLVSVPGEFAFGAEWSPDGSRIAFQGTNAAIWTIRPDGSDAVKVSNNAPNSFNQQESPHWSPDSRHLVYTQATYHTLKKGEMFATISYDILRISASGGGLTKLTGDVDEKCFGVAWR
jgi:dipeptidyl aminopeptidase/acylaminoacyl peptidase